MKLIALQPKWIEDPYQIPHLDFLCPVCQNHTITIPVGLLPHPAAWHKTGDTFENLTIAPSIANEGHYTTDDGVHHVCPSHFFIRNGEIQYA